MQTNKKQKTTHSKDAACLALHVKLIERVDRVLALLVAVQERLEDVLPELVEELEDTQDDEAEDQASSA